MSMLSFQCDELRRMAEQTDWEIPEAAKLMRRAADTIWELRCKLVDVVDQQDEIDQLKAENTKLRELCYEIWEKARLCDANKKISGMRILDEYGHELEERMRELGIPTDE